MDEREFRGNMNRARRHLNSSQAAMAEVKRAAMIEEYAQEVERLKEEAREKQHVNMPQKGQQGFQSMVTQLIGEPQEDRHARETDSTRAKAGGTNRLYLHDAERIFNEHPEHIEAIERGKASSDGKRVCRRSRAAQGRGQGKAEGSGRTRKRGRKGKEENP